MITGALMRDRDGSDGRGCPRALARPRERRGEAKRLARPRNSLDDRNADEHRLRLFRREVRQILTEGAAVRVHGNAATMRVVLDMDLPRSPDRGLGKLPFRDRYEHRRRHLDDGDGEERDAAEE